MVLLFSHSVVSDSTTPWTAAHQASLSFTISWNLLKLKSIDLVMPSNYFVLSHPLLLPSIFSNELALFIRVFYNKSALHIRGQSVGASASFLPMNIQGWFPVGLTSLISLQSKGLSRVFSSTTVRKHQFFSAQYSLWSNSHIHTWWLENHSFD